MSYLLTFKIFQTLLWLKYLLWWSVINSLCYCCNCCYCCNEQHGLCPGETASFTDKCMCSDCSTHQLFPIILPLLKSPYCLSYSNIEIRPMNNLTVASTWSGDRKSCTSLALTENLKMITLTEEDMCKAEIDWKLDLLYQTTKLLTERKSHWRKLNCHSSEHTDDKNMKQSYCGYRESLSGLNRRSNKPQHSIKP